MTKAKTKVYEDYQTYVDLLRKYRPKLIVGFDETGNGAIAGPLAVGACALRLDFSEKVKDSKRYSDKTRQEAYKAVKALALSSKVFYAHPHMIMSMGHGEALTDLYRQALTHMYGLYGEDALYILDGNQVVQDLDIPHSALVKADDFVPAVSAASIVAKVDRDAFLLTKQPSEVWDFASSKGYPTKEHNKTLRKLGPIKGLHRMNIDSVQRAYNKVGWYKE